MGNFCSHASTDLTEVNRWMSQSDTELMINCSQCTAAKAYACEWVLAKPHTIQTTFFNVWVSFI